MTDALLVPCAERMALIDTFTLARGAHDTIDPTTGECCLVELASWLRCAVVPSDHDESVCPVIGAFSRAWNDALPDADRTRLLRPPAPLLIGTNTGPADTTTRAWMATDWLCRVQAPAWLRLAGLAAEAQALESCAKIVDARSAGYARPALDDARSKAAAAWAAARAAAGAAARAAAREAARVAAGAAARAAAGVAAGAAAEAAAGAAARVAAGVAAWVAARAAARAAAGAAAWAAAREAAWEAAREAAREALAPTVAALQVSGVALLTAMCAVGRPAHPSGDTA